MTYKEKYETVHTALRGVLACFNSRTESSTCMEDHHPSCHEYLESIMAKVEEEETCEES